MLTRGFALTILLAALGSGGSAATLRNKLVSLDTPAHGSGCAAPLPSATFQSTDAQLVLWMYLDLRAGESVSLKLKTAAGRVDGTSSTTPVSGAGNYCYYFSWGLSGRRASDIEGAWSFQIVSGGNVLGTVNTFVTGPDVSYIQPGGVVNTASFKSRSGITAPGTLISILGNKLAPVYDYASSVPLPTNLDGVTVTFNGTPVGIFAISPQEVDVQAPWGIPSDTAYIQINNNGQLTNLEPMRVGAADPGIFLDPSSSVNGAYIYRFGADGSDGGVVSPSNPLHRGDLAVFFGTGLGAVNDPPSNFAMGNSDSTPVNPVRVTFGGAESPQTFTVLAESQDPADVGTFWIYAVVPNEAPSGGAVPIAIVAGGTAANASTGIIGDAAPSFVTPVLSSTAGFPAIAGSTYNPGSAISISGANFLTNVKTYVRFDDGRGYKATVPAQQVFTDRVISIVPPYVDKSTNNITAGTVSCTVLQAAGNSVLVSNALSVRINNLNRAPGPVGTVTAAYLASVSAAARTMDQIASYRQAISNGQRFKAVTTHEAANEIVSGLRPLVGGAKEVAVGAADSIDFGQLKGQDIALNNNGVIITDALIAAALIENRKALQNPQVVQAGSAPESIIGNLTKLVAITVQCNSPLRQLSDFVNNQTSNCPSVQEIWSPVMQAARDSLREAVDSTAEDAKRFAKTVGTGIVLLYGGEAAAVISQLVETTTLAQAGTHLVLAMTANDANVGQDKQIVEDIVRDEWKSVLADGAKELAGSTVDSIRSTVLGDDEKVRDVWAADGPLLQYAEKMSKDSLAEAFTAVTDALVDADMNALTERNVTAPDGSNSLDSTIDTAPAIDISGKVSDGSGKPLEDSTVALSTGDDSQPPIVAGPSNTDGTFDLLIPANAPGYSDPSSGQLQFQLLDEHGGIEIENGPLVDFTRGSQSVGSWKVSYDSDDDGDDDSDGSNINVVATPQPTAQSRVPVRRVTTRQHRTPAKRRPKTMK